MSAADITPNYIVSDSPRNSNLSLIHYPAIVVTIDGLEFDIAYITDQCISVVVDGDQQTQVRGDAALARFLADYIQEPDPTPAAIAFPVREDVRIAACAAKESKPVSKKLGKRQREILSNLATGMSLELIAGKYYYIENDETVYRLDPVSFKQGITLLRAGLIDATGALHNITDAGRATLTADTPKTVACDAPKEHVIPVKTNDKGYYYPATMGIVAAYADYERRYGVKPNAVKRIAGMLWVGVIEDEAVK